jgi:hypothetical protein
MSNLNAPLSVSREYIDKDGEDVSTSAFAVGHYAQTQHREFVVDEFDGFSAGRRYDLADNSDTCIMCDNAV